MNQLVARHSQRDCPCISLWLKREKLDLVTLIDLSKTEVVAIYQKLLTSLNAADPIVCRKNKEYLWFEDFIKETVDKRFYDV